MLKRVFGKTGLELSILGFGCMRLPVLNPADPTTIDQETATAMLRRAIGRGVNYVDTAWPYHGTGRTEPGQSEPFVGRALAGGYREKVHLATKLPTWLIENKKQMHDILDAQLKRLDTDHIDFYLAHNLNSIVWPGIRDKGLFTFLDEALKDGRIKYAGFSFHDRYELFEEIVAAYDWTFAQMQYNYLDVDYQAGRRGLRLAHQRGLGVVIMEPLRGGFLINHMPERMKALLAEVRPEWSLADWALRWLWNQPEIGVVLSGMSAPEQTEENVSIAEAITPLTADDQAALDQVVALFRERLKINCTACGYCLPCPQGVDIPKNFSYYNDYFLVDSDEVRARAKFYFNAQMAPHETFAHCVHCRECEEKCPQNLPISDTMDEVATIFHQGGALAPQMLSHLPAPASLGGRGRNVWVAETVGGVHRGEGTLCVFGMNGHRSFFASAGICPEPPIAALFSHHASLPTKGSAGREYFGRRTRGPRPRRRRAMPSASALTGGAVGRAAA